MSERRGIGGHQSARSRTDEWLTPPELIEALGGAQSFDLDPCAPQVRPWPTAKLHYTVVDNGLIKPWFGRVFLNPPYTNPGIQKWLARMAEHGRGVALVFARTETDAFFRHIWERAAACLFLRGRPHFHYTDGRRAPGNSGAPVVLAAYGDEDADTLAFCGIAGQFVPLMIPRSVAIAALQPTWRELVVQWFKANPGPARVETIYRDLLGHPKARDRKHVREKIRQVLQRGPFKNEERDQWALAL